MSQKLQATKASRNVQSDETNSHTASAQSCLGEDLASTLECLTGAQNTDLGDNKNILF